MNRTQFLGLVRHLLTFGSGIAVAQGVVSEIAATEIVGGVFALVSIVWSHLSPEKK